MFKESSSQWSKGGGSLGREVAEAGSLGEKDPLSLEQGQALSGRWVERRWSLSPLSLPCHCQALEPIHAWSSAAQGGGCKEESRAQLVLAQFSGCLCSKPKALAERGPHRGLCPGMRGQTMVGKSPAALGLRPGGQPPNACRALLLSFIHTFTLEESPCQHLLQAPLCRQTTAVV